jgi:glycosyltransferase involved in cell wall biosynthesis
MPTLFYEINHLLAVKKRSGIPRCIDKISEYLKIIIDSDWTFTEVIGLNKFNDFIYAKAYIQSEKVVSINPQSGDIFLSAFSNHFMSDILIDKLRTYKKNGATINFIVYDILPITNPDFFIGKLAYYTAPEENSKKKIDRSSFSNLTQHIAKDSFEIIFSKWLLNIINISSLIFSPSKFVIDDIKNYLHEEDIKFDSKFIVLPLGFDKSDLKELNSPPLMFKKIFNESNDLVFLMVGTIETRKDHKFILSCFDKLWSQGRNYRLIWVGSDGWVDQDFMREYKNHPLLNSKFFLLGASSDEELRFCYEHADALISASLKEGFGLPNIEAAVYGLPIIARDIPVFREICGGNAFYFPDTKNTEVFIFYLNEWIILRGKNLEPKSRNIKVVKWSDVAKNLFIHMKKN